MDIEFDREDRGLDPGGSSGFGLATDQLLAAHGSNPCKPRGRVDAMPRIESTGWEKWRSGDEVAAGAGLGWAHCPARSCEEEGS